MSEKIFAILVPSEASLTAPIAPSIEITKLYIIAAKKVEQLSQQSRTIHTQTDAGEDVITITDHPDLKWWFDQCRKLGSDIAKLLINVEAKDTENKLKLMDMFMNSETIPQEYRVQFTKMALEKKLDGKSA